MGQESVVRCLLRGRSIGELRGGHAIDAAIRDCDSMRWRGWLLVWRRRVVLPAVIVDTAVVVSAMHYAVVKSGAPTLIHLLSLFDSFSS